LIMLEAWRDTISIQAPWKIIEQCVVHPGCWEMHLVSHISQSIRRMGAGNNFASDIFERLHIPNVKEAYQSCYKVNYIP
jgi:hypothetical protein